MMNNSQTAPTSIAGAIKTLTIIYLALLMGMLLFAMVTFLIVDKTYFSLPNLEEIFTVIVPVLGLGGAIVGSIIFSSQVSGLSKQEVRQKLGGYQTTSIIKFALIEGPVLFGIVTFLLTGNLFLITVSGVLIIYCLTQMPTKGRMALDLGLTSEEQESL